MKLKEMTVEFVESRYRALKERWSQRNSRMETYAKLYRLELWEDELDPDERRISVPTAMDTVESMRTLLLTRPPVISVRPSEIRAVETDRADQLEKYLYGCWARAQVMDVLLDAEWCASCLGEGVIRCVYDEDAVEGELPLTIQALDPRNVYANPTGKPGLDREVCHAWKRRRSEIEAEWGRLEVTDRPTDPAQLADWLDQKTEFIDYWRWDVEVVEEAARPARQDEERAAEPGEVVGPVTRLYRWMREQVGGQADGEQADGGEGSEAEGNTEADEETRMVRRRVVTNAIVVDGEFVKRPARMPGYSLLPMIRYAGIKTPMADENGALSVLFSITGGAMLESDGVVGVAAAEAEALTFRHQLVEMYSGAAWWTDDTRIGELDFSKGAINYVGQGKKLQALVPPGPMPAADAHLQLLQQYIQDSTIPEAMRGRYLGDISGIALSALTNPVLMKIASRQMGRERAYQTLNRLMLALTEEYAPPEGWYVHGEDAQGGAFELQLRPDEIGGYYENRVELSASLPKDESGEVMMLAQLVESGRISMETFLDRLQRIKRLASQSPQDEMKRILRDKMVFEGPLAERLAQLVMQDYSPELAQALGMQAPAGRDGQGAGAASGQGMQGMGPEVVPPQAVPEAVGGGGMEALAKMMAMRGQGPGGER